MEQKGKNQKKSIGRDTLPNQNNESAYTEYSEDKPVKSESFWDKTLIEKLETAAYKITHKMSTDSKPQLRNLGIAEWLVLIFFGLPLILAVVVAIGIIAVSLAVVALAIMLFISPLWLLEKLLDHENELFDSKWWWAMFIPLALLAIVPILAIVAVVLAVAVALSPLLPLAYLIYREKNDGKKAPLLLLNLAALLALPYIVALLAILLALVAVAVALLVGIGGGAFSAMIVQSALAMALLAASIPVVVMLHSIWGPAERKTPVRRSFFLNPSTWVMASILVAGISLLIQGVDPLTFINAAGPIVVVQSVFASMATLLVIAGVAYLVYRTGLFVYHSMNEPALEIDENASEESEVENLEDPASNNYITKYLHERWQWMQQHYIAAGLIWAPGILGFVALLALTIDFFTGGIIAGSLMQPAFDFMSQGLISGFHTVAGWPGLEGLGSISEATTLLLTQIIAAITLVSAPLILSDSVSRLVETIFEIDINQEEMVDVSQEGQYIAEENLSDEQESYDQQGQAVGENQSSQLSATYNSADAARKQQENAVQKRVVGLRIQG